MSQSKPSKTKKIITNIVLLFMLIIFPLMSWVYLNKGANFYRAMMAELGDYGNMPAFNLKNTNGDIISQDKFDKKLTLINFASPQKDREGFKGMKFIYDQFTDNSDVLFATIDSGELDSVSFGSHIFELGIDPDKWSFLYGDEKTIQSLKSDHLVTSDSLQQLVGEVDRLMVLVDTNNVICHYISSVDTVQINRAITIMSVLMPRGEKASVKFEREIEK